MTATVQPIRAYTALRRIRGRTLAAATGRSESQISLVLNGQRRGSDELRQALADFLDVPVHELFNN